MVKHVCRDVQDRLAFVWRQQLRRLLPKSCGLLIQSVGFIQLLLLTLIFQIVQSDGDGKQAQPLSSKAVNHEAIHVEQYMEVTAVALLAALMLSLAFGWGGWPFVVALLLYYIIYFVEAGISWVYNTVRRKLSATAAADTAYYASMFEMEAHANEGDNQYIRGRKSFNWIRYFGKV